MPAQELQGRPLGGVPVGDLHVAGQGAGHGDLRELRRQGVQHLPLDGGIPEVALDLLHRPSPAADVAGQILHGPAGGADDLPGGGIQDPVLQLLQIPGLHPALAVLHVAVQGAGEVLQPFHDAHSGLRRQLRPAESPVLQPVIHQRAVHQHGIAEKGQLPHRGGDAAEKPPGGGDKFHPLPGHTLQGRPGGRGESLVRPEERSVQIAE